MQGNTVFMNDKTIKANDIKLILLLLLATGAVFLFFRITDPQGSYVKVTVDGKEVTVLPLSEDRNLTIEGYDGGKNMLVIKNGEAYLEDATCPDKLCVHMGKISKAGQSVICLPNRVVVEIIGSDPQAEPEYDAVVGG